MQVDFSDPRIHHLVVKGLWALLLDPNPHDVMEPSIGSLYLKDRKQYEANVREWVKKYAS
jgi:ubiquitin-conjugating enzyme E2 D/E